MLWSTPEHLEPTPHMGPAHWDMIWGEANGMGTVEFGSGGSTCWIAKNYAGDMWVAVEHQPEWYDQVFRFCYNRVCAPTLYFASSPARYAAPPVERHMIDVVIVDGKWRNEVLANLSDWCLPGTKVFLHDAERNYQIPGFLKEVHRSTDPDWVVNPKCELAVFELS